MFPLIIFHMNLWVSGLFCKLIAKWVFINLEMRQNADSLLKSICYRSAESLVSAQSILAHQRSMPLYTLTKCKKAKPWRINQISRSEKPLQLGQMIICFWIRLPHRNAMRVYVTLWLSVHSFMFNNILVSINVWMPLLHYYWFKVSCTSVREPPHAALNQFFSHHSAFLRRNPCVN